MIQTDKGHCWITFDNGYVISIFNGFGSYSDNHFNRKVLETPEFASIDSRNCEIAILHNGVLVTQSIIKGLNDSVKGYVTPDELADIIYKIKNIEKESDK